MAGLTLIQGPTEYLRALDPVGARPSNSPAVSWHTSHGVVLEWSHLAALDSAAAAVCMKQHTLVERVKCGWIGLAEIAHSLRALVTPAGLQTSELLSP